LLFTEKKKQKRLLVSIYRIEDKQLKNELIKGELFEGQEEIDIPVIDLHDLTTENEKKLGFLRL
jgi:hypothetical protein